LLKISNNNNIDFYINIDNKKVISVDENNLILTTSLYEILKLYLSSKKNDYDIFKLNVRKDLKKSQIR